MRDIEKLGVLSSGYCYMLMLKEDGRGRGSEGDGEKIKQKIRKLI
jgi:hypothetical protein